jgi:hypothetical protein
MAVCFMTQQLGNSRHESFRSVTERFTLDAVLSSRRRSRYGSGQIPEQFESRLVASHCDDGIMELNGNSGGIDFGVALVWGTPGMHALRRVGQRGGRLCALYRTSATRGPMPDAELLDSYGMTSVRRGSG